MKDLKSQLSSAFGTPVPEAEPQTAAAASPTAQGILAEGAHLDSPWMERLAVLSKSLSDAPKLGGSRKVAHADQITAQVMRLLKKVGRKTQARELGKLRKDWLGKRDKAAWAALKVHWKGLDLPDKAYRSLKQQGVDPVKALAAVDATDPEELRGMGAARLKALLTA